MHRYVQFAAVLLIGIVVGWGGGSRSARPAPYSEFTKDISIRQGDGPTKVYRPYALIHDGNRLLVADGPARDPATITVLHFDGSRLQVACTEVPTSAAVTP